MEPNTTIDNLKEAESYPIRADKDLLLKSVRAAATLQPLVENMLNTCQI